MRYLFVHLRIRYVFEIFYPTVFIFGLVLNTNGQDRYDRLIETGRNLAYNVRFAEAESLYTEAARISPDRAESYFETAQIRLWIYLGTMNRDAYAPFKKSFDLTIGKLKKILESNPEDYRATYLLGETYMLRALAEVTAHSYLDAFWAVRSAFGYYNKTLKLHPHFYDAYRGIGEIHYFLEFIPGSVRWSIAIFGLEADKAQGFSELRLAYRKSLVDKVKSALSLAQVYSNYVAEYDSAETLMRELVAKFPRNPMFNYHLAVILIKERRLNEAEKYLDAVLELNDSDFTALENLTLFLKGDIHFKMNDFQNAIKYNGMFIKRTTTPDYTGIANYRLAISYRAIGNDAMMKKCLEAAMNGNTSIYDDARAKERSRYFLKNGISPDELSTLEMKNDIEAGKYGEAYSTLSKTATHIRDGDTHAEAIVALAEASIGLGKYSEAKELAATAFSIDPEDRDWIEARSWYMAALSSFKMGEITDAKFYLGKVMDTDEYKSDNILYELTNNLEGKIDLK